MIFPVRDIRRIKSLKLLIAVLLLLIAWSAFSFMEHLAATIRGSPDRDQLAWYVSIFAETPWKSLAEACVTTMVIAMVYEWWIRRENEKELHSRLFSAEIILTTLSGDRVSMVLRRCLQRLTVDKQFGTEIASFIEKRILDHSERRYNVKYTLILYNLSRSEFSEDECVHFFGVYYDHSYEKVFREDQLFFVCVDDMDTYNKSFDLPQRLEWRWVTSRKRIYERQFSARFYTLNYFEIDGERLEIGTLVDDNGDVAYRVDIPRKVLDGRRHRCSYRVALKTERYAHCLFTDVRVPCKGLTFAFDFSETDILHVNIFDAFTARDIPTIKFLPRDEQFRRIEVGLDNEWVIPKSGVSFTWNLRHQLTDSAKRATLS